MNTLRVIAIVLLVGLSPLTWARTVEPAVVNLQLRWHHQFQFAGYYAALEKGFYGEAGLDVRIHEGAPGRTPVDEVLAGRAQYGEANSELLYRRLQGAPLVALAVIFQHSPSVLLTRRDSGIRSPQDLVDKRVMLIGNVTDADLQAMFLNEGIALQQLTILPSSYDINDLVTGKIDAFNAYLTNEPFTLLQRGIPYQVIEPLNYGIDFYSDILFTSEAEIAEHPARVKAFREATLKGWRYAMDHPQEIIDLLQEKYRIKKSREHLIYEAETMRQLILPKLVEIGHMNPGRWRHMADTFVQVGMLPADYDLTGFIYGNDQQEQLLRLQRILTLVFIAAGALAVLALTFYLFYRRLQREIQRREQAEAKIRELAFYDNLTGLPNRNLFYDRVEPAIAEARRDKTGFALGFIDLDGFKLINDRYGHAIGDRLLSEIARRLKATVRASDTVARFGGDEFVVLLKHIKERKDAEHLMSVLQRALRRPFRLGGLELQISASIGIALFPEDDQDIKNLLSHADAAMYHGKKSGKDQLVFSQDLNDMH